MSTIQNQNTAIRSSLRSIFANPAVGLIGSIASVIGLLLAVIFYLQAQEYRFLTYYPNPARANVLQAKKASNLKVLYQNEPVDSDITAVQVAVWNSGRKSIKSEDILEPIVLYTESGAPILEASIQKLTRNVVGLTIDKSQIKAGRLSLAWRILEHQDGGIIQIIYSGSTEEQIKLTGTIEGQSNIGNPRFRGMIRSPSEQYKYFISQRRLFGSFMIGTSLFLLIIIILLRVRRGSFILSNPPWPRWMRFIPISGILASLLYIFIGIYVLLQIPAGPPFEF